MDITKLHIADGQIEGLTSTRQSLRIEFRDWQEGIWLLDFPDATAFESISAEGEDLAEVRIEESNDWLLGVKNTVQDELPDARCYSFMSAWSGTAVLRVVAKECRVGAKVT